MPVLDKNKAKQVILEIVRQAGEEGLTCKTRLFKAFYFAHLFYAEAQPDYLTDWPIVRMPNGPGIDAAEELIRELLVTGQLSRDYVQVGPYQATRYRFTGPAVPELTEEARAAITQAVEFVQDKSAVQLTDLTHDFSRSWNEARDGQHLDIYVDLIPDEEYEVRQKKLAALEGEIVTA